MIINIDFLKFYLTFTDREAIRWDMLAKYILPKDEPSCKAYNTLLKIPEFVDAVYKSGIIIF